jgi:hypothetical protein
MNIITKHDAALSYATASIAVTAGAWWLVGPIGLITALVVTLTPAVVVAVIFGAVHLMTRLR